MNDNTNTQTNIQGNAEAGNDFVARDKHIQGDEVQGDKVGNDKVGDDKVSGDKVAGDKVVISTPGWITFIALLIIMVGIGIAIWMLGTAPSENALPTPLAIVPDNRPLQPEPTLPFIPATSEETLIIIPLYDDRSEGELPGVNPSSQIYDLTFKAALENDTSQVRVEYYEEVVSDSTEAQALGAEYNAKIVLWGWYNSLKVQPYVELVGERTIQGAGLTIVTSTPMPFYFIEEIPAQAAYIGLYMMGMTHIIVDSPKDLRQAIAFFSAALNAVSTSTNTQPWEAYIWRANCHLWLNEHAKAVPDYDQGIRLKPDDASAYYNRGIVHGTLGNHEQAIQDYTKAIDIDPQYVNAYVSLGSAHGALGNYEQAILNYTKAININPEFALAYLNRGVAQRKFGNHEQAILDYTKAIDIDPQYVLAYLNRGNAHSTLGNYGQAILDYTKAINIDPEYVDTYNNRGYAYFIQEQYAQAVDDYTMAIQLDPQYILTYRNRFHAYYALEKYEEAIADYEQALEIDGSLPDSSPRRLHPAHREEMEQLISELE